ncbi:MAG TPA: sulfotransferase [Usitatibacter sp.]|nr:sulfotransferase [Usitatibacter sp.]
MRNPFRSRRDNLVDMGVATRLEAALGHHRAGRLDDAAHQYEAALEIQPGNANALHYLGVIAHQRGEHARAVELIERAVAGSPRMPQMFCNLSEAQRAAGRIADAERSARRALELRAAYPQAQLNLAAALFAQRRFGESEAAARAALELRANLPGAARLLADSLREQNQVKAAEQEYRRILDATPDDGAALANLGWMLVQSGRLEEGLELCRRAAERSPHDPLPLQNLGRALLEFGRLDEAMQALERALQRAPDSALSSYLVAVAWQELGEPLEARNWLVRARELDPRMTEVELRLAMLESDRDNPEGAIKLLDAALAADPQRAEVLAMRAKVRLALGDVEAAVADHRAAIAMRPESATLHTGLGATLASAGDIPGAVACERKAIELNPRCVPAYAGLLTALRHRATASERDAAAALLDAPWMTDARRASLHYGLAAYHDGRAEYAAAAQHMVRANALRRESDALRHRAYDPDEYEDLVGRIIATFTPALLERFRPFGSPSDRPVFVFGMPRSGTTLIEQIIASHPRAFGAGERRFAQRGLLQLPRAMGRPDEEALPFLLSAGGAVIEAAAQWHLDQLAALDGGRALRIVDKMPDNYSLLGWLAILFPRARFVYSRRDLRDIALSCWITNFTQIRWANDLDHMARRMEQHRRLMAHWRKVLPVPMLEVDYEGMVADQEGQSRRLVEWLGLEWDDRCLSFHKTQRLVRTASVAQVREPMYNRSVARWTHYEEMLAPLIDRLGLGRAAP